MKTLYKRLLTFFIGFPIVLGLVFIQVCHHLPMHFFYQYFSKSMTDNLYNAAYNLSSHKAFDEGRLVDLIMILRGHLT